MAGGSAIVAINNLALMDAKGDVPALVTGFVLVVSLACCLWLLWMIGSDIIAGLRDRAAQRRFMSRRGWLHRLPDGTVLRMRGDNSGDVRVDVVSGPYGNRPG